ncbi:MAG: UbiA family prenyltransferase [bacterium]
MSPIITRLSLWDSIFLLRPTLIFPLWTMVLAGHRLSINGEERSPTFWVTVALGLTSLFGIIYLLNQLKDRESDLINGKLPLIARGIVSSHQIIGELIVLASLSLITLAVSGMWILIMFAFVIFIVAGYLYNFSPIALESRPWGGVLANLAGGCLLIWVGNVLSGGFLSVETSLGYILAFTAGGTITAIPDRQGDESSGKTTFAVRYGSFATIKLALAMVLVSFSLGILMKDWVILFPAGLAFVGWTISLLKRNEDLAVVVNK